MGFLGWLWHTVIPGQSIWPWCVLFRRFHGMSKGSKWAFLSILGYFDNPKISWRKKCRAKCFDLVSRYVRDIPETPSEKEIQLKLTSNVRFSNFLKFPIHFQWISIVKFERPVGGSNDLQSCPNFFSELFMIFVHKIKKANKILKKVGNMVHPSSHLYHSSPQKM